MRVGIIGGGQLARMLALAGYPLGLSFKIYDPSPDACAGQVAPLTIGNFNDVDSLLAFAEGLDVVTFDFENVPAESLRVLAQRVRVLPDPAILDMAQDRLAEKACAGQLGIPCGRWWAIDSAASLQAHIEDCPGEYVLKTRRLGYDGKGQVRIGSGRDLGAALSLADTQPCILESLVPFDRELSIIGVRAKDGDLRFYPLIENRHVDGILHASMAPAARCDFLQPIAEKYLSDVAVRFQYVGVVVLELFQVGEVLLFNELAPRVHNSGHWSIEGAVCSQFENHLRAICGWPLGDAQVRGRVIMRNCIGSMPSTAELLRSGDLHIHDYGKQQRRGRKVGHITRLLPPGAESDSCFFDACGFW